MTVFPGDQTYPQCWPLRHDWNIPEIIAFVSGQAHPVTFSTLAEHDFGDGKIDQQVIQLAFKHEDQILLPQNHVKITGQPLVTQ